MKITQAVPAIFAALAALTMKTIITSNWRPLHRALSPLLLCITALWAMPRSVHAQLYVGAGLTLSGTGGTVIEYNAATGALINAPLITGLGPQSAYPPGLLVSGNTLFVTDTQLGTVGAYDATNGRAINANLITLATGTSLFAGPPSGLAVSGNTLFVGSSFVNPPLTAGVIGTGSFDATTGAAINATEGGLVATVAGTATVTFPTQFSQIPTVTCTAAPTVPPTVPPIVVMATVASQTTTGFIVKTVDTSTGLPADATVNWVATGGTGGITGVFPSALAVSGNTLFVAIDSVPGTVGAYHATTLAPINANLITGLSAPIWLGVSGNTLFVNNGNVISTYNATTGALINASLLSVVVSAPGLALSGNTLFAENVNGSIGSYNATTGTAINANLISAFPPTEFSPAGPIELAVAGMTLGPIANAGPNQKAQVGILVTLDGSASSDPTDQLPLTYAWSFVSKPAGSAATLSNPSIVNPTFTPDAVGNYVIQLIVTNAPGLSSGPATVTISTFDAPPVANAGPAQTITAVGTLVQLNGSESYDAAGLPITYQWSFVSKPAGSSATLIGPTTVTPSFLADVADNYSIQLVVTDSLGTASSPAGVTVSFSDVPPVANAGSSQSTVVGGSVTLNGSKSTDTNGAPLTYQWSVVSAPTGSKATISNPTAEIASLTPDVAGTFVVQLIVNDGTLNSLPATTEIMAVAQATSLTQQIRNLQGVIRNLPPSAFRNVLFKDAMLIEFNAVLLTITVHDYSAALQLLQNVILPQTNGCATTGAPDRNDWIINCPDQSMVYTPLLNIIAEVRALRGR